MNVMMPQYLDANLDLVILKFKFRMTTMLPAVLSKGEDNIANVMEDTT